MPDDDRSENQDGYSQYSPNAPSWRSEVIAGASVMLVALLIALNGLAVSAEQTLVRSVVLAAVIGWFLLVILRRILKRKSARASDPYLQPDRPRIRMAAVVVCLLICHVGLLIWHSHRSGVVVDETGHLPSGLFHLTHQRFDLYAVNPPLVRMVAALPVWVMEPEIDWGAYSGRIFDRAEFRLGANLAESNEDFLQLWRMGRWACLPFSLLGATIVFVWARELYGSSAGLAALTLWCLSPTVLSHASLMTPDAAAASLGIAAGYSFERWRQQQTWPRAGLFGFALGVALLTKFTWLVLYGLLPVILLATEWFRGHHQQSRWWHRGAQLVVAFMISIYVINLGYLFEGSGTPLRDYQFSSRVLSRADSNPHQQANMLGETWLGSFPVPLPRNFVLGIDHIKSEFEQKQRSFLIGEARLGGWWYYYLVAMSIKMPLGTLLLIAIGLTGITAAIIRRQLATGELVVAVIPLTVLGLVSSSTGFNHHLRYVLPAFPFLFVLASRGFSHPMRSLAALRWCAQLALVAAVISPALSLPHSAAYFNEAIGGPVNGWRYLDHSNVDWGQDMPAVRNWFDTVPENERVFICNAGVLLPRHYGIDAELPAQQHRSEAGDRISSFPPGWYVLSGHRLNDEHPDLSAFHPLRPARIIGYSNRVYHLTEELVTTKPD